MESNQLPWNTPPLNGWDIVGMNHYKSAGIRMLFVAMTDGKGHCIQSEGASEIGVFRDLYLKALRHEQREEGNKKIASQEGQAGKI